jgi:hypothetical protein
MCDRNVTDASLAGSSAMSSMKLNGFSVHIAVEGEKAEEYNVEVSPDKKTATCWIVSEAGKVRSWLLICTDFVFISIIQNFSIHWDDSLPSRETSGSIEVDGMACGGSYICATHVGEKRKTSVSGVRVSSTSKRRFTFSVIEPTGTCIMSLPNGHRTNWT